MSRLRGRWRKYMVWIASLAACVSANATSSFVNFETPPIHPVDLSPDKSTLAVCNLPDARLMLFDVSSGTPVDAGTIPVGYDPVTARFHGNSEVWVVNHISDSISVIDLNLDAVVATLETLNEPCDVVFAGSPERAFVSCSEANAIQVFDPADLGVAPTTIAIEAEEPKALAVSPDGNTVYAAIFESGNSSTIIEGAAANGNIGFPPNDAMDDTTNPAGGASPPPNSGSGFSPAINASLPTPPRVSHIVKKDAAGLWRDDNGSDWTPWISGAKSSLSGRPAGWDVVDRDVAVIDTSSLAVSYANRLMNICMGLAVNPASGDITVVGTQALNEIRFEPKLNGTFIRVDLGIVDPSNLSNTTVVDLNGQHLSYSSPSVSVTVRDESIGDPRGIVWNSAGTRGYVTGMGSNNLIVINASGQRLTAGATLDVGAGPTGIALDESRSRLYILNRFEGSLSVVNTSSLSEVDRVPFYDPTPDAIKMGRKHLYNTHINSGLGQLACGSCHVDARMDRLAWDLGDPAGTMKAIDGTGNPPAHNLGGDIPGLNTGFQPFHPMKGPMVTLTLQDIIGKEPFHWRGDRDGLEEFNEAFTNLQGADSGLSQQEMDEYKAFLATIHFPPNPFRNLDNSLPTNLPLPNHTKTGRFGNAGDPLPNGDAVAGLALYRDRNRKLDAGNLTCVVCHTLPLGSGTDTQFSGTLSNPTFTPIPAGSLGEHHLALVSNDGVTNITMKIPELRNLYEKVGFELTPGKVSLAGFGFLHDGSIDTLARFVSEPVFIPQNDQEVADLVALLLCFSGSDFTSDPLEPPGVFSKDAPAATGKQTTLTSSAKDLALLNQLIPIADTGSIQLIMKTNLSGNERGALYVGSGSWELDDSSQTPLTTSALLAMASTSTPLTFTAVPAGLGTRLGIDRDEDNLLDYDEILAGSKSTTPDTDSDGLTDYDEVNTYGTDAALSDSDSDGLNDSTEINVTNTDPVDADSDNDSLNDGDEVGVYDTDPNNMDSDGDTLSDGDEVIIYHTNPIDQDTDGDGINDNVEIANGTNPLVFNAGPIPTIPPGAPFEPWAAALTLLVLFAWGIKRTAKPRAR